jgi:hypothetical protein
MDFQRVLKTGFALYFFCTKNLLHRCRFFEKWLNKQEQSKNLPEANYGFC